MSFLDDLDAPRLPARSGDDVLGRVLGLAPVGAPVSPVLIRRAAPAPAPASTPATADRAGDLDLASLIAEHDADPERDPWPDDWLGNPDPEHWRACRKMWASAMKQILRAAIRDRLERRGTVGRAEGRVGASWLDSRDLRDVADLAGFDGEAVRARVAAMTATEEGCRALLAALAEDGRDRNGLVTGSEE